MKQSLWNTGGRIVRPNHRRFLRVIWGLLGVMGAVVTLGAAGTAAQAQDTLTPKPRVVGRIPFTPLKSSGLMVVTFRINRQIDAKFLIASDSHSSHVSPRLVKKLNLTASQKDRSDGTKYSFVTFDTMHSGAEDDGLSLSQASFYVDESGVFITEKMGDDIDGILGGNILSLSTVILDFETNQVAFLPAKLGDETLRKFGVAEGVAAGIPLTASDDYRLTFTVPARVGKTTFPLHLDTLTPLTYLIDKDEKLKTDGAYEAPPGEWSLPDFFLPVSDFALGENESAWARNLLNPFECLIYTRENPYSSALGLDYLSHFRVIIDYPAAKLYLSPIPNSSKKRFPTAVSREVGSKNIGDIRLRPSEQGKWTIMLVAPGGISEKSGLRVGDVVETINGKKPDGLSTPALLALFHEFAPTDDFEVTRDGKTVKVTLRKR